MLTKIDYLKTDAPAAGSIIHLAVTERLTDADSVRIVSALDENANGGRGQRLLVELKGFSDVADNGRTEDAKLSLTHIKNIEKIAVVGETSWMGGPVILADPETNVRFFDVGERDSAAKWLQRQ